MRTASVVLATLLMCCVASPASSGDGSSWTLRVHGAIVESSTSHDASFGNGVVSSIDTGGGIGVGAEYRLSDRIGLELSTLFAGLDIETELSGTNRSVQSVEMSVMPVSFGLPIHFDTGDRVDFFVAPTLSLVNYTDMESSVGGFGVESNVSVDSDVGIGAALGLDVPIGKGKWAFSTGLRYIKTQAEEVDIDPVIVTIGFAYRF